MKKIAIGIGLMLSFAAAYAGHSWGNYHFAFDGTAANVTVLNSTTSSWDGYVAQAISDWDASSVINMTDQNDSDSTRTRRRCRGPNGQVRICNYAYGQNGWLGLASLWASGDHITSGTTKLNDTYFSDNFRSGYYNTPVWKQSVTCQELGHNIGLAHQDEIFDNDPLYSCMDYQDPPYEYPNAHDYEQLEALYDHADSGAAAVSQAANRRHRPDDADNEDATQNWGQSMGRHGNHETFIKFYTNGTSRLTSVIWVNEE